MSQGKARFKQIQITSKLACLSKSLARRLIAISQQ